MFKLSALESHGFKLVRPEWFVIELFKSVYAAFISSS
jgi:hypothetical protein